MQFEYRTIFCQNTKSLLDWYQNVGLNNNHLNTRQLNTKQGKVHYSDVSLRQMLVIQRQCSIVSTKYERISAFVPGLHIKTFLHVLESVYTLTILFFFKSV